MTVTDNDNRAIFKGIDVFKLIASCFVVLLHAIETNSYYPKGIQYVLTRFAVPFFFIASGYFFYRGLDLSKDKRTYLYKYIKRIFKLFVIWALVIYLPFTVYEYFIKYIGQSWIKIALVLFRRIILIGPGPYWYLVALLWSSLFLYWCYSDIGDTCLMIAICMGLFFSLTYSSFQASFSNFFFFRMIFRMTDLVFSSENNFLMCGIPFMGIGYLLAKHHININKNTALIIFTIATFFRILEYRMLSNSAGSFFEENNISVAFIPQAISYFLIGKSTFLEISENKSRCFRQLSSFIYFSHVIILYNILNPLLKKYTRLPVYADALIIPKVFIVLLICIFLFIIIKKKDNKILNLLING